jgi:hypothetical protein
MSRSLHIATRGRLGGPLSSASSGLLGGGPPDFSYDVGSVVSALVVGGITPSFGAIQVSLGSVISSRIVGSLDVIHGTYTIPFGSIPSGEVVGGITLSNTLFKTLGSIPSELVIGGLQVVYGPINQVIGSISSTALVKGPFVLQYGSGFDWEDGMLNITKLTVRSFNLDNLDIFWEISPVAGHADGRPHEIYNYDFYVLRSENAVSGYEQIGGPFRDRYEFRDIGVSQLHKYRQYFYKIIVVHRPSGVKKEFGPASSSQPEPDLIAAEAIRLEDTLFREFAGRRCYLFPKRTFGPVCTCYDAVLGRNKVSRHAPCFGTGYLGGYRAPIEVWVQFDPSPKSPMPTSLQEVQSNNTVARMISFPPVSPNDILVESENKRWRVQAVSQTERLRAVVRQELQLHEIPRGDIEYTLPVNVDLKSLKPAAERNFTNPQHTDQNEDLSDIFAVYGKPRGTLR